MKKFYVSPAIEISKFVAEDILCASTISFDGGTTNYDVVSNGIEVDPTSKTQRVAGTTGTAPFEFYN
ncbi:MAG: hypothetical protein IJT23_00745 [Clostridia bacterium]|nr:hypothetical protein [Clostridia bacterium]